MQAKSAKEEAENYKKKWRGFILWFLCIIAASHNIIKSKLTSLIPSRDFSNEKNFDAMKIYVFPNSFIPLIMGYFVDYLGENIILISFLLNIVLAYFVQWMGLLFGAENYSNAAEYSYISSILFALTGESFLIPLLVCLKNWYEKTQSASHKFNTLISAIFLGRTVKMVLVTLLFQLEGQSDEPSASKAYYQFQIRVCSVFVIILLISLGFGLASIRCNNKLKKISKKVDKLPGFLRSLQKIINKRFTFACLGSGLLHASSYLYFDFHYGATDEIINVRVYYYLLSMVFAGSFLICLLFVGKHIDRFGSRTELLISSSLFFIVGFCCSSIMTEPNRIASSSPTLVLLVVSLIMISFGMAIHIGTVFCIVPCISNDTNAGISYGYLLSLQNLVSSFCILIAQYLCQSTGLFHASFTNVGFNINYLCLALSFLAFVLFLIIEIMENRDKNCQIFTSPNESAATYFLQNKSINSFAR